MYLLETKNDYRAVEELTREAFWNVYKPGADEHYFVHTMRNHPDFIPELAFVLEIGGTSPAEPAQIVSMRVGIMTIGIGLSNQG